MSIILTSPKNCISGVSSSFATLENCFLRAKMNFQARKTVCWDFQLDFQPRKSVFSSQKSIFDRGKLFSCVANAFLSPRKLFSKLKN